MKKAICIILVSTLLFALVACGNNSSSGGNVSLVIADSGEWWGHDVVQLDGTFFTQALVTDPLVHIADDGSLLPNIASEVDVNADGTVIKLTIPDGMKFADGTTLAADDVVASIDRARTVGPMSFVFDIVDTVRAEGNVVVITLSSYSFSFAMTLSGFSYNILSREEIESKSDDELFWGCTPYGQYFLDEYVPGSHVVLKKNPNYITHYPKVQNKGVGEYDTITVRFISDDFSRVQAFNVDDVQVAMGMSVDNVAQISRDDFLIEQSIIPNVVYCDINQNVPLLQDISVRQALMLVVDRQEIVDVLQNTCYAAYSYVTDRVHGFSQAYEDYFRANHANDIERAKKLLADAGWVDSDGDGILDKDGQNLSLRLVTSTNQFDSLTAETLQIQYKAVGVDVVLEVYDPNYRYEVIASGDYDLGMEYFGTADPHMLLELLQIDESNIIDADTYFGIVSEIPLAVDPAVREQLVFDAQMILSGEAMCIPLFTNINQTAWANSVTGYIYTSTGTMIWNDLRPAE